MRQLVNALLKYKNALLYIGLLIISLLFLNQRSFYHRSIFSNASLVLSSNLNQAGKNISNYLNHTCLVFLIHPYYPKVTPLDPMAYHFEFIYCRVTPSPIESNVIVPLPPHPGFETVITISPPPSACITITFN